MPAKPERRRRGGAPVPAPRLRVFLAHLSETGSVTGAAVLAEVPRSTLYLMRGRDPAFKARWEEAQKIGIDRVEDETVRRALDGTQKAVFYAGRQIASVPQFNDRLLQFLLKAHKPETYDRPRAAAPAPLPFDLVKRVQAAEARMNALGDRLPRLKEEKEERRRGKR